MKYYLIIILCTSFVFSQSIKNEFGKRNYIPFSYIPDDADDSIFYGIDINNIKSYSDSVLSASKKYIVNRGGKFFYDSLEFEELKVIYHDIEVDRYENKALYELKNFDCTYLLSYRYRFEDILYCFNLEFNKEGEIISENKFPSLAGKKPEYITSHEAILVFKTDEKFKNIEVDEPKFYYDKMTDSFCWEITEKLIPKELGTRPFSLYVGYINATTGKIIRFEKKEGVVTACGYNIKMKK